MTELENRYRSDHLHQVGPDIKSLPTKQLQRIALIRIVQLCRGEIAGRPLEARPGWPDLSDCRKLYFDEQEHDIGRRLNRQAPRWRIVYRLMDPLPGKDGRMRLQVVAVGPRYQGQIYDTAGRRLARPEVKRAPRLQDDPVVQRSPAQGQATRSSWKQANNPEHGLPDAPVRRYT